MQTYSHFIITAALNYMLKGNKNVDTSALLLGSIAPDMPLIGLTALFFAEQRWRVTLKPAQTICGADYDERYFNDPTWITGHALFHAPPLILLYLTLGYFFGIRQGKKWANGLFWFAIGCALHTAIDIPTHHNDGPLLLFPFDKKKRFSSPISYWDAKHHGKIFAILEHILDLVLIIGMIVLRKRESSKALSD